MGQGTSLLGAVVDMKRWGRLFGRESFRDIETREASRPGADESGRRVLEVALYWRGEALRVEHHPMVLVACGADFGVPEELVGSRAALVRPEQMQESTWTHFGDLSLG
jgi:hypothetical protein